MINDMITIPWILLEICWICFAFILPGGHGSGVLKSRQHVKANLINNCLDPNAHSACPEILQSDCGGERFNGLFPA